MRRVRTTAHPGWSSRRRDGHIPPRACLCGSCGSVKVREMFLVMAKKRESKAEPSTATGGTALPPPPPPAPDPPPPASPPAVAADALPVLSELHRRHPGFKANLCSAYADAARVCLSRHHDSPRTFRIQDGTENSERSISWDSPTAQDRAAWNNSDDATRDGAYAVSLAAVEVTRRLVAVGRAHTKTGADWLLVPVEEVEPDDFEGTIRLEVSGVDEGSIGGCFNEKVRQAHAGDSNLPAVVSVVGFQSLRIRVGDVEHPS